MKRELEYQLYEILNEVSRVEEATKSLDEAEFLRRRRELDTVVRRLHRISRCVRALPYEFVSVHTEVPWERIASLGGELDSSEVRLDPAAAWRAISEDLPILKRQLLTVLDEVRYGARGEEEE